MGDRLPPHLLIKWQKERGGFIGRPLSAAKKDKASHGRRYNVSRYHIFTRMRRGNFTMLKDATGIRWFSRSRIPIINPESVKLVGISLEIADRHRFTHDIFIVYVLMTWNITAAPHICIHAYTRIYVYSPMLSNDNNNWNNREQFSFDSVIYIFQRASKFAFTLHRRYYYAPCVPTHICSLFHGENENNNIV